MKAKRGRPRKPKADTKSVLMQVRVDPAEKRGFTDAAQLSGQELSVWVRDRLRRAARQELEETGQDVPFLPRNEATSPL